MRERHEGPETGFLPAPVRARYGSPSSSKGLPDEVGCCKHNAPSTAVLETICEIMHALLSRSQ